MKRSKKWLFLLVGVVGALSFYVGGFVVTDEKLKSVSGMCIGLGAALFCLGIGNFISSMIISKTESEEIARKKQIEVKDERNIRIREKVGAKINQVVIYMLSVILLAMGFLRVSIVAILMVSSVFLLEFVLAIALSSYYSKRM